MSVYESQIFYLSGSFCDGKWHGHSLLSMTHLIEWLSISLYISDLILDWIRKYHTWGWIIKSFQEESFSRWVFFRMNFMLNWIFFYISIFLYPRNSYHNQIIFPGGSSDFDVRLIAKKYVEKGSTLVLRCDNNVQNSILYKVSRKNLPFPSILKYMWPLGFIWPTITAGQLLFSYN